MKGHLNATMGPGAATWRSVTAVASMCR